MAPAVEPSAGAQATAQDASLSNGELKPSAEDPKIDIIDIRQAAVEINLKEEIQNQFHPKEGPRKLPTLLLYDSKGLQLFEKITYLDEYYLTNTEIQLLEQSAVGFASRIPSGSMVIELGSGNLRKVQLLLQALEDQAKDIDYYALDLSRDELVRTLAQVPAFQHVRCHGLHGTYDDGREWMKTPSVVKRQKCVLSLGSSIGNFERDGAAQFLRGFADVLQFGDSLLIAIDSTSNPSKVYHAYNDREGVTHQFILNGLLQANDVLGYPAFNLDDWRVIGEYVYDDQGGRHQAFYSPVRDVSVLAATVRAHERIQVEESLKYSEAGLQTLWRSAGLVETTSWWTSGNEYGLHHLTKSPFTMSFNLKASEYAKHNLPTLEDWRALWSTWDIVTQSMLTSGELLEKPIKLRNACIFYLGHIPTFLDIQLTKTTKEPATEPASYTQIFERGIDPDVDNPEHCHEHSEAPETWPPVDDILQYQERVRARLNKIYSAGQEKIPRDVGRAVWIGFEHELMHIETLLYMMLQSEKTDAPPHFPQPDFESLAKRAVEERVENEWFTVPTQQITVGLDDPEHVLDFDGHFGWDNEKPSRAASVASFQAQGRPITNEEYAKYIIGTKSAKLPVSWVDVSSSASPDKQTNGIASNGQANGGAVQSVPDSFLDGKSVRTVFGLVPLRLALDWPVFASYDELAGCAAWMGGRIPTLEEARSIYNYVDFMRREQAERKLGRMVPAVNGHLVNNGVEETPPGPQSIQADGGAAKNSGLFVDLDGANVGFTRWHPVPVTAHGNRLAGQAEMGGVWEWTSTPLTKHEGFIPDSLYPQYTSDFFDGKHNIVLGGSWATHPRIAGRKTFVNWYQRNYPYAWAGVRLVRDL